MERGAQPIHVIRVIRGGNYGHYSHSFLNEAQPIRVIRVIRGRNYDYYSHLFLMKREAN